MLKKLSNPTGLVVSVEDLKARIRFEGAAGEDDDDIEKMIRAATARYEHRTGRVMLPTEFEWRRDDWYSPFDVPVVPIRDITEIFYIDEAQAEQAVSADDWYWASDDRGGVVSFVDSFGGPALSDRGQAVRVRFEAGYDDLSLSGSGDDPELQPDPRDVHAIMMLAAHWYANRSAVGDKALSTTPQGFDDLVAEPKIYR